VHVHTYLNYGGNCEEAFRFYEQHLGAKITFLMRHGEAPGGSNLSATPTAVLHARLQIAQTAIMASDVPSERFERMRSVYLSLAVDSSEEAERVHALLAEGGEVYFPMQETFFAHRFSQLRDKFGTSWMILHERALQPPPA
jgi:PhnB protein